MNCILRNLKKSFLYISIALYALCYLNYHFRRLIVSPTIAPPIFSIYQYDPLYPLLSRKSLNWISVASVTSKTIPDISSTLCALRYLNYNFCRPSVSSVTSKTIPVCKYSLPLPQLSFR